MCVQDKVVDLLEQVERLARLRHTTVQLDEAIEQHAGEGHHSSMARANSGLARASSGLSGHIGSRLLVLCAAACWCCFASRSSVSSVVCGVCGGYLGSDMMRWVWC